MKPIPGGSNPRRYVLDANALLAFYENRAVAGPRVRHLLDEAFRVDVPLLLSAVNWGEVFYTIYRQHGEAAAREQQSLLTEMPVLVIPADFDRATRAAALKQKHRIAYADSFAAELAMERGAFLVTADPEFSKLGRLLSVISLPRHAT